MTADESPGLMQRLCPHWFAPDGTALDLGGTEFDVKKAEKCLICGHRRWHISVTADVHPSQDVDFEEELSRQGLTVVEVEDSG